MRANAPEVSEERAVDKMSGINEKDVACSRLGLIKRGLEFVHQELTLRGDVLGQRLFRGTGTARVRCENQVP